jgi:hypothetical protein
MTNPRNLLILVFLLIPFGGWLKAQRGCATEVIEQQRRHPEASDAFERWMAGKLRATALRGTTPSAFRTSGEPDLIPVVVHVIHNGEPVGSSSNISDAQIFSQIEVLNEDFQRLNRDTVLTQPDFRPIAARLNINFVLARRDPSGQPTDGIVRVNGNRSNWNIGSLSEMQVMKALSYWPAEDYLNIWVTTANSGFLGIAQYPDIDLPGLEDEETGNRLTDGIVVDYRNFGSVEKLPDLNLRARYAYGRTATHELGHFFGLRHVWGDAEGESNCDIDDFVEDTPLSSTNYDGECPSTGFSCGSTDMVENYLYYTDDACMNAFSRGQVERMEVVLANAPRRFSLLNAPGAFLPDGEYYDLVLGDILSPGIATCQRPLSTTLRLENRGTLPIERVYVQLSLNGISLPEQPVEGINLLPGASAEIGLGPFDVDEGLTELQADVRLDSGRIDVTSSNNRKTRLISVDVRSDIIPVRERFEAAGFSMGIWTPVNPDGKTTWQIIEAPSADPRNRAAFIDLFNYFTPLAEDWLYSPVLDFSDAPGASLVFKVSHRQYPGRTDRLRLYGSDDCGQRYTLIREFSSQELASGTSSQEWMPAGEGDWKTFTVGLSDYAGLPQVRLAFASVNGAGNNILLDDIEFYANDPDQVLPVDDNDLVVFPNPSDDGRFRLSVYLEQRQTVQVLVYETTGKLIVSRQFDNILNQTADLDLSGRPSGVYLVRLVGSDFVRSEKIAISR